MAGYQRQRANWVDYPDTSTPVTAANLNGLDQAVYDLKNQKFYPADFGTVDTTGSSSSLPAVQAAVDAANTAGGGTVLLPAGTIGFDSSLTHGVTAPIEIVGEGTWHTNNGATVIKRLSGTSPLISCTGTGTGTSQRSRISFRNLTLDGNGLGGSILVLDRCNDVLGYQVRIRNGAGIGLEARELWNSEFVACRLTAVGSTTTSPAVLLDQHVGGSGCSVVTFLGCEWEGCTGTEVKLDNLADAIQFIGGKMERLNSLGTYTMVNVASAQGTKFVGLRLILTANSTNIPTILTMAPTGGTGFPLILAGCELINSNGTTAPDCLIDHTAGRIVMTGCVLISSVLAPATAHWKIGASVPATGVRETGNYFNQPQVKFSDARTGASGQTLIPPDADYATLTYSASMTPNCNSGRVFKITATNGTAFTINAPTNPKTGLQISFDILNSSGGAMGAVTWNAAFKLDATGFVNPANTKRKTISFYYDGTNWVQVGPTSADI